MTQVSHTSSKADVYARVTERIVEDLAAGVRPWMKTWSSARAVRGLGAVTRPLRHNGAPYRGVNVLLLWGEAQARGFTSSTWMTYRQAREIGAQVRKGEAGSLVVYADRYIPNSAKSETNERGEQAEREVAFLKGYTVAAGGQVCNGAHRSNLRIKSPTVCATGSSPIRGSGLWRSCLCSPSPGGGFSNRQWLTSTSGARTQMVI